MVNRCRWTEGRKLGVTRGKIPVIVTGATGRLGRLLHRIWSAESPEGLAPLWSGRGEGIDLQWDILDGSAPCLPAGAVVLHLAAVLGGGPEALRRNSAMAVPVMAAARRCGARAVLFASTAAVHAPSAAPATEDTPPAPANSYGQAKLAAEAAFRGAGGAPVVILRIGNVVGADALLGPRDDSGPIVLDPVPGRSGGPVRSWIGPLTFSRVLARLCRLAGDGALPPVLNVATDPPLAMADLLQAAGRNWRYGPPNPAVVPAAVLSCARLARLMELPRTSPAALAAELAVVEALP